MTTFASIASAPPGGKWFWEDGNVLFESPSYDEVTGRIRAYFLEKGIARDASAALAEYMCPRMPAGFCRGFSGTARKTANQVLADSAPYFSMPLATADVVQRRLERCFACPSCSHNVCMTCRRMDEKVRTGFGGRRAKIPADRSSGVCTCAGAYAMAVASVVFDKDSPAWEGTPDTCWRNDK